jgi:hypothetical protein
MLQQYYYVNSKKRFRGNVGSRGNSSRGEMIAARASARSIAAVDPPTIERCASRT